MNKAMDKLLNNIRFDKRYVLFSIILVIIGVITGSLFVVVLNSTDKALIIEYIGDFINTIKDNQINYMDLFKNTAITNFIILILFFIIGFTYFFFPINILILFYKSFIIGFSLSSFILTYKIKGILLSIIYIFPHMIINILLFSLLAAFTSKLSINMIKNIIKRKEINMGIYMNKYLCTFIIILILLLITTSYEAFIVPTILKALSQAII